MAICTRTYRYILFIVAFFVSSEALLPRTNMGLLIDEINREFELNFVRSPEEPSVAITAIEPEASAENVTQENATPVVAIEPELTDLAETPTTPITDFKESLTKKDWGIYVYIAGKNNLSKFVKVNLQSMSKVGSTKYAHVVAQVDEMGREEITRVHVGKNKVSVLAEYDATDDYISGTKESLVNFVAWAIKNYPAEKICLILWNHGAGVLDPHMWDRFWFFDRDSDEFNFNQDTGLFELRNGDEILESSLQQGRGIAFNEEHSRYLTNRDLREALGQISDEVLNGRKIDIVVFDACLMSMIEICMQISPYAEYMVASQEVVPGNGLPYSALLEPFMQTSMRSEELAFYITYSYALAYKDTFADFTLSAVDMQYVPDLQRHIHLIALLLSLLIESEYGEEIIDMLFAIRASRKMTTAFFNRDYIDLNHALFSIKDKVSRFAKLEEIAEDVRWLQDTITDAQAIIRKLVFSNVHGCNPVNASGLSIYWPRSSVHSSYQNTICGSSTQWRHFLNTYVAKVK